MQELFSVPLLYLKKRWLQTLYKCPCDDWNTTLILSIEVLLYGMHENICQPLASFHHFFTVNTEIYQIHNYINNNQSYIFWNNNVFSIVSNACTFKNMCIVTAQVSFHVKYNYIFKHCMTWSQWKRRVISSSSAAIKTIFV